jgi:ferrous iron transport protein A
VGHAPPGSLCRLSQLPLGTDGTVESVHGQADLRRRLLEMGFCNHTRVTAIRRAPLGDPIEFFLRGYYLSLRKEEARWVWVMPTPQAG